MQQEKRMKQVLMIALLVASGSVAVAATEKYELDPNHTYPSFAADHMGISFWRGKLNTSSGSVMFDKATGSGTLEVTMDLSSVDFGQDKLNEWATGKEFFDVAKYPQAKFTGKLAGIVNGAPTRVDGELTLHGVTKPVTLKLDRFKCIPHPMYKRDYCGADALATIKRDEFGLTAGKDYGFSMDVMLQIQVEALKAE
jgi:polyisoprenoid-binding protein YceI